LRIKHSDSDNALQSLSNRLDSAQNRLNNCVAKGHDVIAAVYISTYTITPNVTHNGNKILDKIRNLASISPNCICLIRTASPSDFARTGWLRKLQQTSINYLRNNCYVVHYSRKRAFTNHAKFLLYFHVCFSENIIHYSEFFGSTNITQSGLGIATNKRGNYEEFMDSSRPKYSLGSQNKAFLSEILDLIRYKTQLYSNPKYIAKNVNYHSSLLETLLERGKSILNGDILQKNIGSLFDFYSETEIAYNQTLALLDDIPGKRLTETIIESLFKIHLPMNPNELEMIISEPGVSERVAKDLDLTIEILKNRIAENTYLIRETRDMIFENYEKNIYRIQEYYDETEKKFSDYLRINAEKHDDYLSRALSFRRESG